MPILEGKGMYLWIISRIEGGDPNAIAELAKLAGLSHVLIKVADGSVPYNIDRATGHDNVPAMVAALRSRGIQAWGWQYIYGRNPQTEASMAIQRVGQFHLDGFIVNAEIEFKQKGMDAVAQAYMQALREGLPTTPIGLSSYRYPSLHRPFPFETFLEYCDLNMPQVYWIKNNNPAQQLLKSLHEYQGLHVWRPYLPTGAAYPEGSWTPTPQQVTAFLQAVRDYALPGANFWEWYYARRNNSVIWNSVRDFPWALPTPGVSSDIAFRYIDALNTNDPLRVAELYSSAGVHVNAERTIQGPEAISNWYNQLMLERLPNARYEITGATTSDNLHVLTWIAESDHGQVLDGKDSLGVKDDRIAYHYTYFTVQQN